MAIHDLTSMRLFVPHPLAPGVSVELAEGQAHYLLHVLRMKPGGKLLVFNGIDGEWQASIATAKKRSTVLAIESLIRPQAHGPDIDYVFAPLKHARLDYMVQKAAEMGVRRLRPVLTRRTQAGRVNLERMRANAIEAAEQCGVLTVAEVLQPEPLAKVIEGWVRPRPLIFCDEEADCRDPLATLARVSPGPVAVLVGPEGGFDAAERQLLREQDFVVPLSLGERVIRADTAAVAVLALVNATLGDWR
jgi:16S rRNA (uracil1498-N3)-methyltransferase